MEATKSSIVHFHPRHNDYGHIVVSRIRIDGSREIIGHIYTEIDEDENKYVSTNQKGRELFSRTHDFNELEKKFERYAVLLSVAERNALNAKELRILNYSPLKQSNLMQPKNPKDPQKTNQLVFIEYEKPTGNGHLMTIGDSYRNVIGRIYRSYNDQTKKYEYVAFDYSGKIMMQGENLQHLKNEYLVNRNQLLEQAHQRRLAAKDKSKNVAISQSKGTPHKQASPAKEKGIAIEQKNETIRPADAAQKLDSKTQQTNPPQQNQQQSREDELRGLRSEQETERDDRDIER